MLQILLTILKILGILLLVILGIILTVLLVVLLVPLRYRGDVSFEGKPKGSVMVSWLLRIISVRVEFDGEALKALVKILWFKIFQQTLWPSEDVEDTADAVETLDEDGFFADVDVVGEIKETNMPVKPAEVKPKPEAKSKAEAKTSTTPVSVEAVEDAVQEEKPSFIDTLSNKVQSVVTKLIAKVKSIYTNLSAKYAAGQDKINMVREFLGDAKNKKTIRLIWNQILKLFKHILPRKMSGRVKFGFDDPATTGQILTYISPFYGVNAKTVAIEPVFDEKVMEGELHLKGRIRVGTLLWIVVRVFFDKNFRILLKKVLKRNK